jgi:hypothetical protein
MASAVALQAAAMAPIAWCVHAIHAFCFMCGTVRYGAFGKVYRELAQGAISAIQKSDFYDLEMCTATTLNSCCTTVLGDGKMVIRSIQSAGFGVA